MSEPKRYSIEGVKQNDDLISATVTIGPAANGDWVRWEDYARLKRQVEELKEQPDPLTAYLYAAELSKDNVRRLKAFAERLIKAGDAIALDYAERIEIEAGQPAKTLMRKLPVLRSWAAAKKGESK
jgi:hypothetical protein